MISPAKLRCRTAPRRADVPAATLLQLALRERFGPSESPRVFQEGRFAIMSPQTPDQDKIALHVETRTRPLLYSFNDLQKALSCAMRRDQYLFQYRTSAFSKLRNDARCRVHTPFVQSRRMVGP